MEGAQVGDFFGAAFVDRVAVIDVPAVAVLEAEMGVSDHVAELVQARIVRMLVERVDISATGADIRMRTAGLAGLVRDLRVIGPDVLRAAE